MKREKRKGKGKRMMALMNEKKLAKIRLIVFRFFLFTFHISLFTSVSGCFTTSFNTATGRQETLMHDTDKEELIGANVSRKFEEEFEVLDNVEMQQRVDRIMNRLVPVTDRNDIVYVAKVLDDDMINAVALPGGYVYVFRGLVEEAETDDELASVIAHELAHVAARHSVKRLQAMYGRQLLVGAAAISGEGALAAGLDLATASTLFSYSQEDEQEADRLGIKYMRAAGYDPNAAVSFLKKLQEEDEQKIRRFSYFRTHPRHGKRISAATAEVSGEITFREYLNLTEKDAAW